MIQPKKRTEDLLLSITKICEKPNKQTHIKPEETLEFKLTKPRETVQINHHIPIQGPWMIGLTSLEVYISFLNKAEKKYELNTETFDEFSFEEL